ncbi:hypothetical protein BC628DRAFT_1361825 [Trametes gibbosa]|nr:hypothetical protein BC628DRAFT_1361825 [Trametes gibbosa]
MRRGDPHASFPLVLQASSRALRPARYAGRPAELDPIRRRPTRRDGPVKSASGRVHPAAERTRPLPNATGYSHMQRPGKPSLPHAQRTRRPSTSMTKRRATGQPRRFSLSSLTGASHCHPLPTHPLGRGLVHATLLPYTDDPSECALNLASPHADRSDSTSPPLPLCTPGRVSSSIKAPAISYTAPQCVFPRVPAHIRKSHIGHSCTASLLTRPTAGSRARTSHPGQATHPFARPLAFSPAASGHTHLAMLDRERATRHAGPSRPPTAPPLPKTQDHRPTLCDPGGRMTSLPPGAPARYAPAGRSADCSVRPCGRSEPRGASRVRTRRLCSSPVVERQPMTAFPTCVARARARGRRARSLWGCSCGRARGGA